MGAIDMIDAPSGVGAFCRADRLLRDGARLFDLFAINNFIRGNNILSGNRVSNCFNNTNNSIGISISRWIINPIEKGISMFTN